MRAGGERSPPRHGGAHGRPPSHRNSAPGLCPPACWRSNSGPGDDAFAADDPVAAVHDRRVVPAAAVHRLADSVGGVQAVVAGPPEERVGARAAGQDVVPAAARQVVVAGPADQDVDAVAAVEAVVAGAGVQAGVADPAAQEEVAVRAAEELVVAGLADYAVTPAVAVEAVVLAVAPEAVVAGQAVHEVDPRAAVHHVAVGGSEQPAADRLG